MFAVSAAAAWAVSLPLLPPREERAGGEEVRGFGKPLSPALSPLVPRGEREKNAAVGSNRARRLVPGNKAHSPIHFSSRSIERVIKLTCGGGLERRMSA